MDFTRALVSVSKAPERFLGFWDSRGIEPGFAPDPHTPGSCIELQGPTAVVVAGIEGYIWGIATCVCCTLVRASDPRNCSCTPQQLFAGVHRKGSLGSCLTNVAVTCIYEAFFGWSSGFGGLESTTRSTRRRVPRDGSVPVPNGVPSTVGTLLALSLALSVDGGVTSVYVFCARSRHLTAGFLLLCSST